MSLNRNQALDSYRSGDLIGLGMEADALRRKLHPEGVVTYSLNRGIPWPRAIAGDKSLCSTDTSSKIATPSATPWEETFSQIAQAVAMGVSTVVLESGPAPNLRACEQMLSAIHRRFPEVSLSGFSAQEIAATAQQSGLSIRETLAHLLDAGLSCVRGDGAGILSHEERPNAARQLANRSSMADWLDVHRTAHLLGMHTAAELAFWGGGFIDQFLDCLDQIHRLQQETGGFAAFYLSNDHGGAGREPVTAVEYLKALAIARLYLEPIRNLQCGWDAQGLKVLQLSFRFGANDAGSIALTGSAGAATEEQVRHTIRGAGLKPVQRNALYTACYLN